MSSQWTDGELLWAGGEVCGLNRRQIASSAAPASGALRLSYFRAKRTEKVGNIGCWVATAASGLTLARMGLYSVAYDGSLTLVASCANNASLFGSTGEVTAALSASYVKMAGEWYAFATIQVGTTPAALCGFSQPATAASSRLPRIAASLAGQTDLPAGPVADNTLATQNIIAGGMLLP